MSYQAVKEYLTEIWRQYKKANRPTKSKLLDEVCKNTGMHRKSVIRLFSKKYKPRRFHGFQGGRRSKFSEESKKHLEHLWVEMNYMCPVRMHAALDEWINFYIHNEFNEDIKNEIMSMSVSSINRFLKTARSKLRRKRNSGTRRVRKFITKVPVRDLGVFPVELGHCEIDCVAHCGGSLSGEFAWTLTLTDIVSGWTECESMWGKTGFSVRRALENIENRLPFKLKTLYVDNGSEFLNSDIVDKYVLKGRKNPIKIFRGRPYKKNDQCYVEQKNYTHVRHLFGYGRVNWQKAVAMMNGIYRKEWSKLQNYFMPQQRLKEKFRVGSKVIRKMSRPITPLQRLQDYLPHEEYRKLIKNKVKLNPIRLRRAQKCKVVAINRYLKISNQEKGKLAI